VVETESEAIYRELDEAGELVLQVDGWRRWNEKDVTEPPPPPVHKFKLDTYKLFLDGAFGSRTAAISSDYIDDPGNTGILMYNDVELIPGLQSAVQLGWRLALHAIGDRAVEQACRVLKGVGSSPFGPHRIEHVQTIGVDSLTGIKQVGAVASIQPVHYLDDTPWLSKRIDKELCNRTFAWNSLHQAGIPLALGTDWPVANPDPLLNIHSSINRSGFTSSPNPDFPMDEGLLPHTAIRAVTFGWALAAGCNAYRGAIVPGQAANFTIVSGVSADLRDWSSATVEGTIIDGILYSG
jgi:predicted amidohydrolase YtcJ